MSKSPRQKVKVKQSKSKTAKGQPRTAVQRVPQSLKEPISTLVAMKGAEAFEAFIVAGAQVLQEQYGFSQEQVAAWATATTRLGGFYLRLANKQRSGTGTAVKGEGDEPQP